MMNVFPKIAPNYYIWQKRSITDVGRGSEYASKTVKNHSLFCLSVEQPS